MGDLIERLRMGRAAPDNSHYLMQRAADEIERLTADVAKLRHEADGLLIRNEKLEAALKPFADAIDSDRPDLALTLHDLRMAHEAIADCEVTDHPAGQESSVDSVG